MWSFIFRNSLHLRQDPRLLRLNPDAGPNKFWEKKGLMPDLVRTFGVKFGVQANVQA
jgi:hypothetical protein